MDRNKAIEIIKSQCPANKQLVDALEFLITELKESEEEKIRREFTEFLKKASEGDLDMKTPYETFGKWLAWLEKQCQTFTKKDVDDAYLKGVCDAKHELEKQCESHAKDFGEFINSLSEQFQEVSFAKISRIAVRVKKYLEQCNISNAQSKDVWHDADETPVVSNRQILVLFKDSDAMVVPVEDWESLDKPLKWAFIRDLIR